MRTHKGFTMVELIVVIVILGILSATALPKFMDLSGSATKSVLKATAGAMKSADAIVYSYLVANGKLVENTDIDVDGVVTRVHWGHHYAGDFLSDSTTGDGDTRPEILEAIDLDVSDWSYAITRVAGVNTIYMTKKNILDITSDGSAHNTTLTNQITATNCYISYSDDQNVDKPAAVQVVVSEC